MSRRGYTLLELLLSLTLIGIVSGIVLPRIGSWADRIAVDAASARLRGLLDQARVAAIRLDRPVALVDSAAGLRIATTGSTPYSLRVEPLPRGATVSGLDRAISFGPNGLALGLSNRTIQLQRGRIVRTIVLSRLGRLR